MGKDKDFDYRRIFNENITPDKNNGSDGGRTGPPLYERKDKREKKEKRILKEKKYIATFLMQSVICLIIIGSILVVKYMNPQTFVSVSSVLNGLYENNITLSDLNRLIDEKLLGNEALAAFFNMTGN